MTQSQESSGKDSASPMPGSVLELASSVIGHSMNSVRKALGGAANDWKKNPEPIHQLRVRCRRSLAALKLFHDVMPRSKSRWFKKTLKAIRHSCGEARDLDVLIDGQLARCGPASGKLGRIWRSERKACQKPIVRLHNRLRKKGGFRDRVRSLLKKMKKMSESDSCQNRLPADDWARTTLAQLGSPFFDAIPANADADSLHQFRISAKRLRYANDLLEPVLKASDVKKLRAALAELQDQLGALQDHTVARDKFTESLAHLSNPMHQEILRKLIQAEDFEIGDRVDTFRLWSASAACEHLKECLREISTANSGTEQAPIHVVCSSA